VGRWSASALCCAIGLVALGGGSSLATRASAANPAASEAQALRTCVDRWNQDNMLGWGPALVNIAVRQLLPNEADHVGVYDHRRHCTAAIAHSLRRTTFVCVINAAGGYGCSRYSDGAPPLTSKNGAIDTRGVLKLDVPLRGTHATPALAWQRRYPHVDSYIHPWTRGGTLRRGLTLDQASGARHYHGTCFRGTEFSHDAAALRCVSDVQFDPCYPRAADWNRRGAVVACAAPGYTSFGRFVVTRRS
jgi:hypothetical protein